MSHVFGSTDASEGDPIRQPAGVHPLLEEDGPRSHAVDAHLRRPLQREEAREGGEARLGRRVVRVSLPHLRGPAEVEQGHDRSPRRAQQRQRCLHQVEGTGEVRVQHGLELRPGELVRGPLLEPGRAAHQQIQPAQGSRGLADDPLGLPCLISLDEGGAAEQRRGLLRFLLRLAIVHRDPGPRPVQLQRDGAPDALRGARDQRLHPETIRSLLPPAMGKKNKAAGKARAEAPPPEPSPEQEIPISAAPLPLQQLDARALGEFLELCFADRRLLELCGELRLYSPGYRLESMPPNQVARLLAAKAQAPPRKPQLPADVMELRKELEEARKGADRVEKERESLREQLAAARADIAGREKTLGEVREELSQARAELTRASAEVGRLTAAGEGRALSDARRLADENRS